MTEGMILLPNSVFKERIVVKALLLLASVYPWIMLSISTNTRLNVQISVVRKNSERVSACVVEVKKVPG